MSWASRRQFKYLAGLFIFLALIVFAFTYKLIFKQPTCSDGKQNGEETGVDCGGSCIRVCDAEATTPVVIWSRAFPVIDNNYNLVAFVENRNKDSAVVSADYEFRIYDTNNKLLGRRQGKTFIPPNQQFPVFESRFYAGDSNVKSISFEFTSPLVWVKKDPTLQTLPINVSKISFDNNPDTPTLSANIDNNSIYDIPEFDVIAILYDIDHNAINASKTHKGKLLNNSSTQAYFTWPEAFDVEPVMKEVLIEINPFSVSF